MSRNESAPLHGLRVLEVGTHRAGAFAGALLADLGADVVKVETGGSDGGSAARVAFDRGKRSVVAGRGSGDLAQRLLGWADVVVEEDASWRGGSPPARLDEVVHCSVSAFGDAPADARPAPDPDAEDLLVQALSGNMDLTGFAGGPPCEAGIPVADLGAGIFAAIGVLAGVVARGPRRVEVAKTDVSVALLSYMAVGYFADGEVPTRVGTGHSTIFPYNSFEAADGEVVVAPFTSQFWRNFATAAGRDDLATAEEYRSFGRRLRAKDELLAEFSPILRRRTVDEWVAVFAAADVPAGPVLSLDSAVSLEHTLARGMVPEVTGPDGAATRTVGSPFHVRHPGGATFRPDPGPVPRPGADTEDVVAALGEPGPPHPRTGTREGAALAGIRVLDLTRMFAGPCATEVLADLGADVVKVEEPRIGDPTRRNLPLWGEESAYFMSLNRGKRSVTLDLKSGAGREVLLALIDESDVLVENFRPGVMERLGLGPDALAQRRPGLVYCSLSGFGATGPLREKISFDLVNQAMAGMIELTGDPDDRPVRIGVPIGDMAGGLYLSLAVLAGLRGRERTGHGCWVDLALHDVLIALLSDVAQRRFNGDEDVTRTGSRDRDRAPRGRYRARDGWLVLSAVRDEQWRAAAAVLGIADDDRFADGHRRKANESELDALIGDRLAGGDVAAWVRDLTAAGVPAAPVHSLAAALDSPLVRGRGLAYDSVHPAVGPVRNLASPLIVDGRRAGTGGASPVLGADTDAVLTGLGYGEADLVRLAEDGVIRRAGSTTWS
ncbi:crotonobetainyl-CoA:carnitine CoA-transferase CaiB-like acyl-CoA transferase [Pseudonocardia sediminis]|uniref:Crotonobetainyl-CoA:carnitine CoA-transferase CaiB-like acyl-CoA transferase n=1 Tax=Pseudonocardia sediminis TaxID=1397368 RepID=A0A4Q7V0H2_PSEST|nr:CoA transferase [Pseudonocardia sediminis]RZT86908.1 crotonobetainyl-CoA:carnitine CoA-transferase CaiB-like acyl-CoA transferase [Pseudonocardia sediminis]